MALWSVRWQFDRQMLRGFLWHMRSASMSAIERTGDSEDMFCDLTSFSDVIRCMENCRIELNINLRVIRFIADNSITILILCLFCVCDERWRMNDRREANRQMTQHSIYSSCVMVNALMTVVYCYIAVAQYSIARSEYTSFVRWRNGRR